MNTLSEAKIKRKWIYNRFVFVALVALIYSAIYSRSVIALTYHLNGDLDEAMLDIILSYEYAFILLFLFTGSRIVFSIITPILFLVSSSASYFIGLFKIRIDSRNIALLFETPKGLMSDFITTSLVWNLLFSLVLGLIAVLIFLKYDKKDKKYSISVFFSAIFILSTLYFSKSINQYMPFNILNGSKKYITNKFNLSEQYDISNIESELAIGHEDLIVVLVIGESARADHFSLNGYERDTTPRLGGIKNLVNFKNVESCSNLTIEAKPCLMTRAQFDNYEKVNETTFISIFRKLNFETVWFDNAHIYEESFLLFKLTNIISEVDTVISKGYRYDVDYLPHIKSYINSTSNKTLLIVDSKGSHWPYDNNYRESLKKWEPICDIVGSRYDGKLQAKEMSNCNPRALINSYDNSILATDYYLAEIISMLEDKNALLIYVSDHGESLGEDGYFLHGQSTRNDTREEQFRVPMVIWGSKEYKEKNSVKFKNIENNSKQHIRHNSIFHTILDCSSISSEVIDKSLSLCSEWQPGVK